MARLEIRDLHVAVGGTEILRGIDLDIESGAVEVIMGPNGSGKSTLAHAIMGHPGYEVTRGSVTVDGEDLLALETHERAVRGLFHLMQYPTEVSGVRLTQMLAEAFAARDGGGDGATGADADGALAERVREEAARVHLDEKLLARSVNADFSGGEKKRAETVQLAVLRPRIAVVDEVDSGLDVDALRDVARRIEALTKGDEEDGGGTGRTGTTGVGVLAITHYARLLDELKPDRVHVLLDGRIVKTGDPELARELEETGYEGLAEELGIELTSREERDAAGREAGRGVAMEVEGPMTQQSELDF